MQTDNRADLRDYYALALGAGIGYRTPRIAGHVEMGLSGFFMFNLHSSALGEPDPKTGRGSRYEVGLFNVSRPDEHEDLDRLEELYVRYHFGRASHLTLGRQMPTSPFVNAQDGRMRPTLTEGAVLDWQLTRSLRLRAEYLTRISPRSTVEWFSIGESVGLLPGGVTIAGEPSRYAGHVSASQLVILGLSGRVGSLKLEGWDTYVPGLFHTVYVNADWHRTLGPHRAWWLGAQLTRQWAGGNGRAEPLSYTYIEPGARSLVVSGQAGYRNGRWTTTLNATRIGAEGRFLMPREWGREPFYTFLMRERNEGLGDMWAVTGSVAYQTGTHWRAELATGFYQLPDVSDTRLNKYSLPAYAQFNGRVRYQATGWWRGLAADLLLVHKANATGVDLPDPMAQNRVDMNHLSLVLNYHF